MAVYLHRVAADISSKDTSTTPPGGQYKIGFDKELDEAPAFPPDPDFGEIESIAPNPLTNETVIRYRLKKECDIELIIYDWLGQETKTLVKGRYKKGNYVVTFQNEGYANSSYMCALRFNGAPGQVKIMQIVK
jgi:hypothetical protein